MTSERTGDRGVGACEPGMEEGEAGQSPEKDGTRPARLALTPEHSEWW